MVHDISRVSQHWSAYVQCDSTMDPSDSFWFDVGKRPFLSPQRNKPPQERFPRKRRAEKYFPVEREKHPVSLLYEYCSLQHIEPVFSFYEISQTHEIEYGCVVTVENFSGEGKSFSKKIAKHQAASNLLWKLMQPDYLGEEDITTKRFVSETGVISVHYEEKSTPNVQRSCIRSPDSNIHTRGIKKRVKWEDTSEGESEFDEASAAEKMDLAPSSSESEDESSGQEASPSESKDATEDTHDDPLPEVGQIDDYLSERLLKTNISLPTSTSKQTRPDSETSDEEIVEIKLNDEPKKKRKKCSSPVVPNPALTLKRKVCLREMNPIGYLQEACQQLKIPMPTYIYLKECGKHRTVCILQDHKVHATGETPKEAKKAAASLMIEYQGW